MPINIHGKSYNTVAERITSAGKELLSVETEVLFTDPVVIKATITTSKGKFTGISAANPSKQLEKESPWEVAETSAVGRALAFAGYETTNGIASAEEMAKLASPTPVKQTISQESNDLGSCPKCHSPLVAGNNPKVYAKCSTAKWDKDTKTASGCDYVCWMSDKIKSDSMKKIEEMPDKIIDDEINTEDIDSLTEAISNFPF